MKKTMADSSCQFSRPLLCLHCFHICFLTILRFLSVLIPALGAEGWAGYDAILSLAPLISFHDKGYTFDPILQDGKVLCLTVLKNRKVQLTIKDSMKIIPGGLIRPAN